MIADHAIVADVRIRHQPIVIAHARNALILHGAGRNRHMLEHGIAVAHHQLRRLITVLFVLRLATDVRASMKTVVLANGGHAFDGDMRPDNRAGADLDVLTNDRKRANFNVGSEFSLGMDNCGWMDLGH